MTDHDEPSAWQPDPGDAINPDLVTGVDAEDLDEDRLGLDPLEEGMDPPEQWAASDQFGVSGEEHRDSESLDQRLAQETEDVAAEPDLPGENPGQTTEINESGPQPDPSRQAADEAGGSAARAWRAPDPDEAS